MGLPGRTSLARILLLLAVVLSGLALAPRAALARVVDNPLAGVVDNPRTPLPGSATLPVRGPIAAGVGSFAPERVLVGFEAGVGERRRTAAAAAVDGRVVAGAGRERVVALDPGADVRAAARRLAGEPGVAFAEPDWIRRVDACDPNVCWHLQPRPGANVVAAHTGDHRGAGRTVAVVDTGVATGVADLAGQVSRRWHCASTGCEDEADPDHPDHEPTSPHGTEVASVVAALDDTTGTTGVAPQATIVSYRVDTTGGGIPISHLRQALLHIAADDQIDVVNLSLGGTQWSDSEKEAVDAVLDAGKLVVASAGNNGDRIPQYPAAFPGVISVGATDDGGEVAGFSSYGKVDVVAPGDCVAVAVVPGFDQDRGCPGDDLPGVPFNSGTSFAAPIVSGLLALAPSPSPLVARLALESSADEEHPGDDDDAKPWAHGLADAAGFMAAHDPSAPPALVLETSGDEGNEQRRGSGDGQLPHPDTTYVAYAFQAAAGVTDNPGTASFSGATADSAAFAAAGDGVYKATLASGDLDPGPREERVDTTVDGQPASASVPLLALAADDQAPGVDLVGAGADAWRRLDSVDGSDLDDVYAVTLAKGDRLDVSIANLSPDPVAALLFNPGTEDVFGQLDQAVACGGGAAVGCPTPGLHFDAPARGTYLLDLYATASSGGYRLTWTVHNAAGLPIEVPVAACSPNGDGVQDRCAWQAGAISGWTIASFVTSGATSAAERAGPGAHTWDGDGASPAGYTLRVLYTEPGGRPCCAPSRWSSTASGHGSPTPGPPPTRSSPGPATATATPPPSP